MPFSGKAPAEPVRNYSFSDLAPNFAAALMLGLHEMWQDGYKVAIFEGRRCNDRQQWLYGQGRMWPGNIVTKAQTAMRSWHGFALAADIVVIDAQGRWHWPEDPKLWRHLDDVMDKYNLTSGIDWKFQDKPHVQPKNVPNSPTPEDVRLFTQGGYAAVWKYRGQDRLTALDTHARPKFELSTGG